MSARFLVSFVRTSSSFHSHAYDSTKRNSHLRNSHLHILAYYSGGWCGARIAHSVVARGSGGRPMFPPGNLDHMRMLLRLLETTITTQNLWQLERNSGDSPYGRFSEPLPFGISLCI